MIPCWQVTQSFIRGLCREKKAENTGMTAANAMSDKIKLFVIEK